MSVLVHLVVGELDLLEWHDLLAQLIARERRVGVCVQPVRGGWVCLAGHQPRRPVVRVTVTLVVHRHDVHEYGVPLVCPQPRERHPDGREHPPAGRNVNQLLCKFITMRIRVIFARHVFLSISNLFESWFIWFFKYTYRYLLIKTIFLNTRVFSGHLRINKYHAMCGDVNMHFLLLGFRCIYVL